MTTTQLFFSMTGVFVTIIGAQTLLLNARISDLGRQVAQLIQYMVTHEGKIGTLEERTKNMK